MIIRKIGEFLQLGLERSQDVGLFFKGYESA
jgi:hypothetical protein